MNPLLGRWISADPLAVHAPGQADLNLYAYVSGAILKNVDPLGLEEESAQAGDAASADEMVEWGRDKGYVFDQESERFMRELMTPPGKFEGEDAYDAQRRADFINAPLDPTERASMAYVQERNGAAAAADFMALRAGARAWIYDNMPGFDFASNGAGRRFSNEVERNKAPDAVFKHWAGFAQDWQPIVGPRDYRIHDRVDSAAGKGRMVSADALKGESWNDYNENMASIARGVGLKPGFGFKDEQGQRTPHPEHFERTEYNGNPLTSEIHEDARRGTNGLDPKAIDRLYTPAPPNVSNVP